MAKRGNARRLPSTPGSGAHAGEAGSGRTSPTTGTAPHGSRSAAEPPPKSQKPAAPRVEPEYLIKGTGCVAGLHRRGEELDAGRLGQVPPRRTTRIGVALILWCLVGTLFIENGRWTLFAMQLCLIWLAFSAVVQRRAGHRGRCWRTRAWRHAWGGLVPSSELDPTRPSGD